MAVAWVLLVQWRPSLSHMCRYIIISEDIEVKTEGWGKFCVRSCRPKNDQGSNSGIKVIRVKVCCFKKGIYKG